MKILIELSDKSVAALAKQAEKQNCSIEELISMKLERKEQPIFEEESSDEQVEEFIPDMYQTALENFYSPVQGPVFTTMNAYIKSFGEERWLKLAPNTRKKIGRRFKAYVDEIGENEEKLGIKAVGKTATNSITYQVKSNRKPVSIFGNNK